MAKATKGKKSGPSDADKTEIEATPAVSEDSAAAAGEASVTPPDGDDSVTDADTLMAQDANDTVDALIEDQPSVAGGEADDTMSGGDSLEGSAGDDTSDASVDGTLGDDTVTDYTVTDDKMGGDTVDGDTADSSLEAQFTDDTLSADDTLSSDDTLGNATADDTLDAAIAPADPPDSAAEPREIQTTIVERKGGFVPMVVGGLIAAALGYGAAVFSGGLPFGETEPDPFVEETTLTLDAQSESIAALEEQVGEAQDAIGMLDTGPLTAALAGIEDTLAQTNTTLAGIDDQVAALESRLTALEKQPLAEAVSPEAIAAYERELEELRVSIQEQREAMDAQRVEIESIAAEAMQAEQSAVEQASLAENRAALAEVLSAAQAGEPYAAPMNAISANGVEIPGELAASAEDGLPTMGVLASDFPELSRRALRAARNEATGDAEGGNALAGFLQNQLGARSVTPRDGDDPDAVLSRAEDAVRNGNLDAALTEIASLPEPAQAVLSDWVARAETRRDALAAADALAQQLNQQ